MESHVRALPPSRTLSVTLFALLAAAACGSGGGDKGTGGTNATGGAGTGGGSATGGTTGTGGGATGGITGTGGTGTGGSAGGASGTGGQSGGGKGGSGTGGGSTGGAGGSASCAGRALSLSANATGTADDKGSEAEVVIDLGSALPIGNSNRTVEFWAYIKTTDWVGETNQIFHYGQPGKTLAFGLDFGTNPVKGMDANHATLNPTTDGGFSIDSTDSLGIDSKTDQWVHIAVTWDGKSIKAYVNGMPRIDYAGDGSVTKLATMQGPLLIGCNSENMNCFNGLFDEFRVWNVARTDAQLKASYNHPLVGNEAGLVGYWKFDDAPGSTTAADSLMGGTPHAGMLMAAAASKLPTFGTPQVPLPLVCP